MRFRKMIASLAAAALVASALSQQTANAAVGVAKVVSSDVRRAARYANVKVAVFENRDFSVGTASEFNALLKQRLAPHWSQLLALRGTEEGQVYTFVRRDGEHFKV